MKEYQEIFSYELDASDKRMVEHNLTYKSKEALIQEYLKEITCLLILIFKLFILGIVG